MPETATVPVQLRADGRVTIPADKRRELGLATGDYAIIDVRPLEGGES